MSFDSSDFQAVVQKYEAREAVVRRPLEVVQEVAVAREDEVDNAVAVKSSSSRQKDSCESRTSSHCGRP